MMYILSIPSAIQSLKCDMSRICPSSHEATTMLTLTQHSDHQATSSQSLSPNLLPIICSSQIAEVPDHHYHLQNHPVPDHDHDRDQLHLVHSPSPHLAAYPPSPRLYLDRPSWLHLSHYPSRPHRHDSQPSAFVHPSPSSFRN